MKLLLDQGLPRSTSALLRAAGIDAIHTAEVGLATAEDAVILERARADHRIVVTLDADFHTLLALSGANDPSVIRIRIEGLKAERLTQLLLQVLPQCQQDLEAGAVASVEVHRVRMRRLPLTPP
jgi:predicted nuclease of predicted toxin-antitoxin system